MLCGECRKQLRIDLNAFSEFYILSFCTHHGTTQPQPRPSFLQRGSCTDSYRSAAAVKRQVQPPVVAVSSHQVVLGWLVFISPTTAAVRIALWIYLVEDTRKASVRCHSCSSVKSVMFFLGDFAQVPRLDESLGGHLHPPTAPDPPVIMSGQQSTYLRIRGSSSLRCCLPRRQQLKFAYGVYLTT